MKPATPKTRTRFENILFATDFSLAANQAIPYIKKLAKHYQSHLIGFHAQPPVANPMTEPAYWESAIKRAAAENAEHREDLLDTFVGIPTDVVIEEGDIASTLSKAIEKYDIDLVVIGTHGRTGLGKLLLGSVAEEIFRNATYPVLTVGPHADRAPGAKGEFREILFATDFSSGSQAAAAYAISLAQEFQARLLMMHVVAEPKAGDLVSWSDVQSSSKSLLRKLVPAEAEAWCKPEYFVEHGDPAERILDLARLRELDLIVLGVHAEQGVPGAATHLPIATAHKVVAHAPCPVLTVRG